ncbi:hypothetical protein MMC19_000375 [Ptychographa xylographoides]|nr:hypothetical protein [Ptychographa xylographoides]
MVELHDVGYLTNYQPKTAPASSSAASAPAQLPSTPAPAIASTPGPPAAPAPAFNPTPDIVPSTPTPASTTSSTTATEGGGFNDPSALTVGAERAAAVTNLISMGFERSQIDRAMRAAFNNPDRAVEYLLNGIPENIQQEAAPRTAHRQAAGSGGAPTPQTERTTTAPPEPLGDGGDEPINLFEAAAQAGRTGGGARGGVRAPAGGIPGLEGLTAPGAGAGGAGAGGLGDLEFLRNNPQFQQLRQIVQTQPRMLEPILEQVGAGNPHLAQLIGEHPDQFLQLLSENADEDAPLPPGAQAISVTEEEREAIERLCSLGFERDLVIQAYFACDKNEDLAANFLFEQPPDEDDA